ncbi:MAG: DegQ family serine endoprotease [Kiritimatiellae bacterium]|nr:DegQ family serine endoprotease [Kiritimatiellia bacterium]
MNIKSSVMAFVMGMALFGASAFSAHAEEAFDFRKGFSGVAAKATPAVVFIQVEKEVATGNRMFFNDPFDLFGEEFRERFFGLQPRDGQRFQRRRQNFPKKYRQTGQGSGFLISKDGYILTNTHVVGDADKITVKLADGQEFKAKKIGADAKTEVAVVKIESKKDLPFLKVGNPDKLLTGEWVIAIGNPFGLKETLTVGVVSAKGRSGMGITDYEDFIQTDAAINPGNSGGPLLNIDGEVVGINTAIYSRSGGNMGIGFAIPIDMAMNVKEQLVVNGTVTRGYIGVMLNPGEVTESLAKKFGRNEAGGVLIAEVLKDGPAYKAGIKDGDIIVQLNGQKVENSSHFRNSVAQIMPNKKAEVILFRDGKEMKKTITVGSLQGDGTGAEGETEGSVSTKLEKMGLSVQNLTGELAEQLRLDAKEGVVIADVENGSAAEDVGLKTGMLIIEVNRHTVKDVKDFEKEIGQAKGDNVLLRVKIEKNTFFVTLPIAD